MILRSDFSVGWRCAMYKKNYRPKRKKPRRKRRGFLESLGQGLLKVLALLLTVIMLCAGLLYALPPALFMVEPEDIKLNLTNGLPSDCLNVLLLGTDELRDGVQRSDAIIVASIGYGRFRLTSLLRDTQVDIPSRGRYKLNAAFAFGGPELMMRTVNQNFGLNIMHYAQVDYVALVRIVDALGGVEIDITDAERGRINTVIKSLGRVFIPLGYTAQELMVYGENTHLDGLQALTYARLRKDLGDDFARTSRQRTLIAAIVRKVRDNMWNLPLLKRAWNEVLQSVKTNMSALQILSLAEKVLLAGECQQLRLPLPGTYDEMQSKFVITDPDANREAFMQMVYGK